MDTQRANTINDHDIKETASLDWEPWVFEDCPFPSNKQWNELANPYLITARIAWVICCKSKEELISSADQMERDVLLDVILDDLQAGKAFFEAFEKTIACAQARLIASACNLVDEEKLA